MRNLLAFFVRYSKWFLFALYVTLSVMLLVENNRYQQSVYISSVNRVAGGVYDTWSEVTGYFHLKGINQSLQASNASLQNEVLNLRSEINELKSLWPDSVAMPRQTQRFGYIAAAVINNNTRHPKNYFTIDRGAEDGVNPGMGIVDQNGVVGIVNVVGPHISRCISLLNETQRFSVKLKDTSFIGSVAWKGKDASIAYLEEIPRHATYQIGDTVVTSGYSTTFPEGIPVGVILNRVRSQDDSFFTFKIKLISDFKSLSSVRVIKDIYKAEIDSLSNFDQIND